MRRVAVQEACGHGRGATFLAADFLRAAVFFFAATFFVAGTVAAAGADGFDDLEGVATATPSVIAAVASWPNCLVSAPHHCIGSTTPAVATAGGSAACALGLAFGAGGGSGAAAGSAAAAG
jgi:hypothetical protein